MVRVGAEAEQQQRESHHCRAETEQGLPGRPAHQGHQHQAGQQTQQGGDGEGQVLRQVGTKMYEDLHYVVVHGKLPTEHHQTVEAVQNQKWFEIFFLREYLSEDPDSREAAVVCLLPEDVVQLQPQVQVVGVKPSVLAQSLPGQEGRGGAAQPVGSLPVEGDGEEEHQRDGGAGGGRAGPGQEAGGDLDGQDSQGSDGGGESQQPGSLVQTTDLPHIDLDTEEVAACSWARQEPAGHHHHAGAGGRHDQPAGQVRNSQEHQAQSPSVVVAQERGQRGTQYHSNTEHLNWKY